MQNLNSNKENEEGAHVNRGVFSEKMMSSNGDGKKTITGNIRGKVTNKYRDLFASSEDIFGIQHNYTSKQPQSHPNQTNRLSVKYKSAINLPRANDDYDNRTYYLDDQQLDKFRNEYGSSNRNYENVYRENEYHDQYENEYEEDANYADEYPNNAYYQQQEQHQQIANEQIENDEEQYDEEEVDNQLIETSKQRKLIFIPKNQPFSNRLLNNSNVFERRKDLNTTNSAYGSQLQCPALNLSSDNNLYQYKYTINDHKYFQKKSSIG